MMRSHAWLKGNPYFDRARYLRDGFPRHLTVPDRKYLIRINFSGHALSVLQIFGEIEGREEGCGPAIDGGIQPDIVEGQCRVESSHGDPPV
jgi:hypothetical protein